MLIYKDKQYLIFDFEDGKTVKYDFSTKQAIGKQGKPVKDLCSQLQGLTIDELCECCTDRQYGKFLRFVQKAGDESHRGITNIGTILKIVPKFSHYEQLFSAGLDDIVDGKLRYTINDIPKGLIKLCKEHMVKIDNSFVEFYKENPDAYQLAYSIEFVSLTEKDVYDILRYNKSVQTARYLWIEKSYFNILQKDYGYSAKNLMEYLDFLKTYEALDDVKFLLREIYDYASMMQKISPKFDRYPKHFLTTHKIASRNYNRLKKEFDEKQFQSRIDTGMEKTFGEYRFIYPKSTQDIKEEAVQQNNCVASYIDDVLSGRCHILFLRKKDRSEESLVTIEVVGGKIVQALQRFNRPLTEEQQEVVDQWNTWYANKMKHKNESEELQNVG